MSDPKKTPEITEKIPEKVVEKSLPIVLAPPSGPVLKSITLINRMSQKLHLNIFDKHGKLVGVEIGVGERLPWQYQNTLGPDFSAKLRKGYVKLA